ncbi:allergen Tha p 1-like [Pectinophora gossypiella]|uniref:allergen Tha p 1-like n=1 Tax=Pectinophora gossypiella TaxID=13191 RepID=UPI00214E3E26|nr:allergen Tha p 1-like [Pectinophora gossypiella]XP_049877119.1 allergen Tha p 1-like [Pectinophora gossypiella]
MKFLIILSLAALALGKPDHYDERYDNFNVDEVIDNVRLLKSYSHCFLGEGKCTSDGSNFKKWIPDAVQSDCGKCTEKQKVMVAKVMKAMSQKLSEEWEKLVKLHDPKKEHTAELNAYITKYAP